jgi:demethylmenaquinone methyltransferase/2-methoxy-6-polyprenyl-1,4-benzoquinol methylase
MTEYIHDKIVPFPESGEAKKRQVADMFNRIAFCYDFMNHLLSGGLDLHWRRRAISELFSIHPSTVLDCATGTGDMAILMSKYLHPDKIIGIDISDGMLELGRKKIARLSLAEQVDLLKGDSETMSFPDAVFEAVTVAFGVRNFEHLEKGLEEMIRVLKPGGKLVVLEFSKPSQRGFKTLYHLYLRTIAWGIGRWISKNKAAYRYLNESVRAFPEGDDFLRILKKTGYAGTYKKTLTMGICTIYCGTKSEI